MTAIGLSFLAIMGFGSATIFARVAMARVGSDASDLLFPLFQFCRVGNSRAHLRIS